MTQLHSASSRRPSTDHTVSCHEAQIGAGLDAGPNFTVLNLLVALVRDPNAIVRFDDEAYVRAAPRAIDENIVSTGNERYVIADGVRSSNQAFNFSLKGERTAMVRMPGGRPTPMLVMRTYNVIRDGKLVTPTLEAMLGLKLFTLLRDERRLSHNGRKIVRDEVHQPNLYYTISLEGMALVSSSWARPAQYKLDELLKREAFLKQAKHSLERLVPTLELSETREVGPSGGGQKMRPYYRSSASGTEDPIEVVDAREITYALRDYVPPPFRYDGPKDRASGEQALRRIRRELVNLRFKIRSICFAIESCKTTNPLCWSDPLPTRRMKYPCISRQIILNGVTIVRTEKIVPKHR
jgi:hypothetical protein